MGGRVPEGFFIRVGLFYASIFLMVGVFMPYFPVWLDSRGMTSGQIGFILAAPLYIRIFLTPAIAFAADRSGDRRKVLVLLGAGTLFSCVMFGLTSDFWTILAVMIIYSVFWTTVMPLTEVVAMEGVRAAGLDYGRMRLWGSWSFIVANFGGGFAVQYWGAPASLWMMLLAASFVLAGACNLPRPTGKGLLRSATRVPVIRLRDAILLARTPLFLLFLLATAAVQSTHAVLYAFGVLHWRSLGISTGLIGALVAFSVLAEIVLFSRSARVVAAIGPAGLIAAGAGAAVIRWSITAFDPPVAVLFAVQLLHGLTFGAAHLGAVHFISQAVPQAAAATAQGLYASITAGLVMGSAFALAGWLYGIYGGLAYLAMSVTGAVGLAAALLLMRTWDGRPIMRLRGAS
ncbi:MAG: MFS transporter [Pseudomonadota bacterium]|nr:MFS transporter [Pseudomonadota bacterium]